MPRVPHGVGATAYGCLVEDIHDTDLSTARYLDIGNIAHRVYMNMNLFNHNNNSADDYVQLNSCGC